MYDLTKQGPVRSIEPVMVRVPLADQWVERELVFIGPGEAFTVVEGDGLETYGAARPAKWLLRLGDEYHYINSSGQVDNTICSGHNARTAIGNCLPTAEAAEGARLAFLEVLRDA